MKRTAILFILTLFCALPALAQSTEFGLLVGGSRRFVEDAPRDADEDLLDSDFSFSNNSVELFWATKLEDEVWFKVKGGRIQTQVAYVSRVEGENEVRVDAEGEVQHLEGLAEYRFSEAWGHSAIYAGLGVYRHSTSASDTRTDWGMAAGVNADFPISRRYGFLVEGAYHWTQADFSPRYLTFSGGLRISF